MSTKNVTTFFEKPLLQNCRSISFENFSNDEQKVDKYSKVCEIMIALLVLRYKILNLGFVFFFFFFFATPFIYIYACFNLIFTSIIIFLHEYLSI